MQSLIHSKEADFRYNGYYYLYQYYKKENNAAEMHVSLQAMEELKDKVSSLIKEDCKISDLHLIFDIIRFNEKREIWKSH